MPPSACNSAMKAAAILLQQVGGAIERSAARSCDGRRSPCRKTGRAAAIAACRSPHRPPAPRRRARRRSARAPHARGRRSATPSISGAAVAAAGAAARTSASKRVETGPFAELDAGRILPLRRIKIARQRNVRLRAACAGDPALRPAQDFGNRHVRIGRDRDEGGVGAVLQQPTHQIGEQIAMAADRRIDAARHLGIRQAAPRRAPRPCRGGAGTRNPTPRAAGSSITLATVSALWVANCG